MRSRWRDKRGVEYDVVGLPSHELTDAIAVDAMRAAPPKRKPRVKEPLLSPKVETPAPKRPKPSGVSAPSVPSGPHVSARLDVQDQLATRRVGVRRVPPTGTR